MSERYYAKISIPKAFLTPDIEKLFDEEFGEGCWRQRVEDDGTVFSVDDELASNGQFEYLETELLKRNIPFDRYSSSYYEYPEETRYFRPATPDTEAIDITVISQDGKPYVEVYKLRPLLEQDPVAAQQRLRELVAQEDPDVSPLSLWGNAASLPAEAN